MKVFFLLFLAHLSSGKKVRWCTFSEAEQRKCSELSRALAAILSPPPDANAFGRVSCVRTRNTHDCVEKIRANKADLASLDAGDVYSGVRLRGLTVAAKEVYAEGSCVFAVAVARRGASLSVQGLKGSRSCHGGAKWTSGWSLPLAFLLSGGHLTRDKDRPLSHAVSEYFNASCVPGAGSGSAGGGGLCALCRGAKSHLRERNRFCETNGEEPFFDSEGALRCLASGAAQVAFVDHLAIADPSASGREGLELLCPEGSAAPLADFASCHLGRGPGRALLTRRNFRKTATKFLTLLQDLFGEEGKARARFELFASTPFGGKNLLFRDATRRLRSVADGADVGEVLGADYVSLLQGLGHEGSSLSNSVVRWCCVSDAEIRKCEEWALSVRSDPLVCVRADSMAACVERIKKNEADAVTLDATRAVFAANCALVLAAVEIYDPEPPFAVALARKDAKGLSLRNLNGKRSCHGCEFCPAGWLLPAAHLFGIAAQNNATDLPRDLSAAYQDYFWKGCMPGADGNLCKVCVGRNKMAAAATAATEGGVKDSSKCAANHDERYYGNMGALRCLLGDPRRRNYGDVAFLEHHNLLENIERLGVRASDFELLCPDGGRAAISGWKGCHLGPVAPSVVATRPLTLARVRKLLERSQEPSANPDFHLFESRKYGESDLLFKDAARRLTLLEAEKRDYKAHLLLGGPFLRLAEDAFGRTDNAGILDFCKKDPCTEI